MMGKRSKWVVIVSMVLLMFGWRPVFAQDNNGTTTETEEINKRIDALEKRNQELEALVRQLLSTSDENDKPTITELLKSAPNTVAPKSGKLKVSGEIRVRPEFNDNFDFTSNEGGDAAMFQDNNDFVGMRTRINLDFDAHENLRVFVQIQDSRLWGEEAATAADDQNVDLHQAYFDLRNLGEMWPTIRIGRQVLSYGDQKLVGAFEWNNIARAFDGVRAFWKEDNWNLDVFATNVAEPDDLDFGDGGDADDDTLFSGIYGTYHFVKEDDKSLSGDAYVFHLRNGNGTTLGEDDLNADGISDRTGDLDFFTIGTRWIAKYHGFDAGVEAAYQTGDRGHDDVSAYALHARAGYTFENWNWKPRFGAEYNFASGDDNPSDGDHETFANLFPTNHLHYGYLDSISWQNMRNLRLTASAKPAKKWYVQLDYHFLWLEEENDAFYTVGGAARGAGTGFNGGRAALQPGTYQTTKRDDEIGQEIDVTVKYQFKKNIHMMAGYSHFFSGDFLDDTGFADPVTGLNVKSDDADFAYFQITVKF